MWRLVPTDNNLGLRAVIPVPGGGHRHALEEAFERREFWANNPFGKTAKMEVRVVMPPFLLSRGWAALLTNPGGGSFSLGPRDSRVIRPRLIGGQDFTALDVQLAGYVPIEFIVLADGLVVGGLTFVLDSELKLPAREDPDKHEAEHPHEGEEEQREELRRDRPRRIRFEIDID